MDCYTESFGCLKDNNIVGSIIVNACIKNNNELILEYDIEDPVELEYYNNIQDEQVKVEGNSVIIKYFLNNISNDIRGLELDNNVNCSLWFSKKHSTIRSISPEIIELRIHEGDGVYNIERYKLISSTRRDNKAIGLQNDGYLEKLKDLF